MNRLSLLIRRKTSDAFSPRLLLHTCIPGGKENQKFFGMHNSLICMISGFLKVLPAKTQLTRRLFSFIMDTKNMAKEEGTNGR